MEPIVIRFRSKIEHPSKTIFAWFNQPGAFQRLIAPWEKLRILSDAGSPSDLNSEKIFKVKIGPIWHQWIARHVEYIEGESFTDIQVKGPFKFWKHIHRVHPIDEKTSELEDEIHFLPPIPGFTSGIKNKILRTLQFRHETLRNDLDVYARYPTKALKILVSGSSGFVGSHLVPFLELGGHQVIRLVRKKEDRGEKTLFWNPKGGDFPIEHFEGFDAVIHLAGKNIASGRWTEKLKKQIASSRIDDTHHLSEILTSLSNPPKVVISASALGIYGNRGEEELTEESSYGTGFLGEISKGWEQAMENIDSKGIKRIHPRFGMILSSKDGALARMAPPFKWGLGAILGRGDQWVSWIAIEDVIYGLYHLLHTDLSKGVNFTSPNPETNQSFSKKLARAFDRPLFLKIGEKPLRFAFKEMADELFLTSVKAYPEKLLQSGYQFFYPELEEVFKRHFF